MLIPSRTDRFSKAKNDFAAFYLGGKLQPLGKLYEPAEYYKRQPELLGGVAEALVFIRPPYYSLFYVPLARMPYLTAYWTYLGIQVALLALWLWLAWRESPRLVLAVGVSLPLLFAIANGQDVILATALCGIAFQLLDRRPVLAGVVLALCAFKVHLFILVPLALARAGYWRTIGGGAACGLGLVGLSFAAAGPDWLSQYLRVLKALELLDAGEGIVMMGNVRAICAMVGLPGGWGAGLSLAGLAGCAALIWRARSLGEALTTAICGGLVFSWHSWAQDFTLLLAVAPFVERARLSAWGQRSWQWLMSPLPYLAILPGVPFCSVLPVSMLAFLGLSQDRSKS